MPKSRQQPESQPAENDAQGSQPAQRSTPPGFSARAQARKLYEAMSGMGTDERAIFDALQTGRSDLNRAIESAFNQMYPKYTLRYWLDSELGGSDYTRAIQLLGRGDFTLAQKLTQAADGWGADEEKIFHALDIASPADLAEVRDNIALKERLESELNADDYDLALDYLYERRTLASKLHRAVNCWGTDESAIWRAIDKASEEERLYVLEKASLIKHLDSDLSASDYLRAIRMLDGTWDNVDKIEVALKGVGTDEAGVIAAIGLLNANEYAKLCVGTTEMPHGVQSLKTWLISDLSGELEFEALETLHQVQLAHDSAYAVNYREEQAARLGEDAMRGEGAAALVAGEGQTMSAVGRLRKACVGAGTDEEGIWDVAAAIPASQGQWILHNNPDNILGVLRSDLSLDEYFRVRSALGGGALGRIEVLRNAVAGMGTTESHLYDAIDAIIAEGVGHEVLADTQTLRAIETDVHADLYLVFVTALRTGEFGSWMRLRWATSGNGTDEDLVWALCGEYGEEWRRGEGIQADVDAVLMSELSTRDYWKAKDLIRGEATTEQEKLARAKEMLERERGAGYSVALVDMVSDTGTNADEAWRDYQVTYNRAYEDGQISESEQTRLSEAEDYSSYTTAEYREAKASFAQWASQIAITIVGIVATVLTAGAAAGPFIAAMSANAGTIATTMVLSAALKVGIQKAIEGEGYDLSSMDTLVDGVGAAIEGGLFVIGNLGAAKIVQGMSKTNYAASIGGSVEKAFGGAGRRILAGGLEGSIDGSIGGMGEGLFRGLANDKAWSGTVGEAFASVGTTTLLHGAIGGGTGFAGGGLFRSMGETFGPSVRRMLAKGKGKAAPDAMNTGSADDIMTKMPDDLESNLVDQRRLTEAAFETNQRMQTVSDDISSDFGLEPSKVGLKGNDFGVDDVSKIDQDEFIAKVLEKTRRWDDPENIGSMTDMSRGRFDVESFEEATAIADSLESRLNQAFGSENVLRKPVPEVYKRHHILVRDPATGVHHEWQIGTEALTRMIEKVSVTLPDGVNLHGHNFHVVMYDVLDKLSNPKVRAKHNLPDSIVDDIGLSGIRRRYDQLMLEAGTVKKGAGQPEMFDERLVAMAKELGEAVDKLEAKHPGLATKLDTKLAAEEAAAARVPESDGPTARVEPSSRTDVSSAPDERVGKYWEDDDFLGGKMDDAEAAGVRQELEAEIAAMNLSPEEIVERKMQRGLTGLNNAPEEWLPKYKKGASNAEAYEDVWGHVRDGNARHAAEAATMKLDEYKMRMANGEEATGKLHWSQYGDTPEAGVHALRRLSKTYSLLDGKGGRPNSTARARAAVFETLAEWAEKSEGLALKNSAGVRTAHMGDGPVHQPEMPGKVDGDASVRRVQDDPQPKMAEKHEGSAEYKVYKNAVAFMSDGKIDPMAAKQGQLGDCYLIAGAAAEARANPEGVRRLIKDNGDGTFDVTLFTRDNWYSPATPKVVKIDAQLPTLRGQPVYAKVGRSSGDEDGMWMALFEKALAQETGSYGHISGGHINDHLNFGGVHELMTGNKVRHLATESVDEDALLQRLADALDNKEPVAAGTYNFKDDPSSAAAAERLNIYANHAYAIESVDVDARTVNLQNPWGSSHPRNVSIKDFKAYYKRLDIGVSAKADASGAGGHQFEGPESSIASILDGLGPIGDNVSMTVVRAKNLATAMASTRARGTASEQLQASALEAGQIQFPSEDVRQLFWSFLTSPALVKFEGTHAGSPANFFVDLNSGTLVVTDLDGAYVSGLSLMDEALASLMFTGEM